MKRSNQTALEAHFRTPEGLIRFGLRADLPERPEFFRLGSELTCYGRHWEKSPGRLECNFHDASEDVRRSGARCLLPFDPSEIAESLRCERYALRESDGGWAKEIARRGYYTLRPLLPVALRKHLQRRSLRGWQQRQFPSWPIDRTVDLFFEHLLSLALKVGDIASVPFIWFWPEGQSGCVVMTHDVETQEGLDDCDDLMALDSSFGIPSSFQLIPGGRYRVSRTMLKTMRGRGFEVNVHDWNHDGTLFRNRNRFAERAARINRAAAEWEVNGFRSGALYRNADWLSSLEVAYDMSAPNVAHLDPQHGGCCTLFPWFVGKTLEIPVTMTQDYSLFNILNSYSLDLWKEQFKLVLKGHGMASFIVHPDYIQERRARGTYRDLLSYIRELRAKRNLWVTQPGDVNQWWRERSRMKLVRLNGRWEIIGAGSERARIAYATLDQDRIAYAISPPEVLPQMQTSRPVVQACADTITPSN